MDKGIGAVLIVFILTGCMAQYQEEDMTEGEQMTDLVGYWEGAIEVPNQPLDIILEFTHDAEWQGTISIPVQNVEEFALKDITVDGKDVRFQMPLPGQSIHFDGSIRGGELKGTFTQAGRSFPFKVEKGEKAAEKENKNFLSIETPTSTLYGELLLPDQQKAGPVALIIPGSGPTDRDGNSQGASGKNNSLKLLAEGLASKGVASVRYDKRGAGKNLQAAVDEKEMRFEVFIDDAKEWLELLEEDPRFTDIVIVGHSQGSLVGMSAAGPETADAFISIAGAARPIDQVLEEQLKQSLSEDLFTESQQILEMLRNGQEVSEVRQPLMGLFNPNVQPFLRSWMDYNPTEQIKDLKLPVLLINGKHDLQVPVKDAELLKKAKPHAELLLIDEMNHVLKKAPENREENLATYTNPELPLAEGLVKGIVDFLKDNRIKLEP